MAKQYVMQVKTAPGQYAPDNFVPVNNTITGDIGKAKRFDDKAAAEQWVAANPYPEYEVIAIGEDAPVVSATAKAVARSNEV